MDNPKVILCVNRRSRAARKGNAGRKIDKPPRMLLMSEGCLDARDLMERVLNCRILGLKKRRERCVVRL